MSTIIEWDQEKTLELIEFYRAYPCLWDSTHRDNKRSSVKNESWEALSRIFECNPLVVKNKIDSLMASFRREKNKARKYKNKVGGGRYTSKWFAFKSLSFLLYQNVDQQNNEIRNNESSEDYQIVEKHLEFKMEGSDEVIRIPDDDTEKNEIEGDADDLVTITVLNDEQEEFETSREQENKALHKVKRQKLDIEPTKSIEDATALNGDDNASKSNPSLLGKNDDCAVYGEHVACKLRQYSNYTKNIVQHYINNILFKADMGKYNTGYDPFAQMNGGGDYE